MATFVPQLRPRRARARRERCELRSAGELVAPDLVEVETVAVLRRLWLAGSLMARRLRSGVGDLELLDLARYPALPFMRRAYELRHHVSTYDANDLAAAKLLGRELLSGDRRLAATPGPRCAVRVLPLKAQPSPPLYFASRSERSVNHLGAEGRQVLAAGCRSRC